MPSEDEILAAEIALARLFARRIERTEAIEVLYAVENVRRLVDRSTQIPPSEGEREICRCPNCGRSHWRLAKSPASERVRNSASERRSAVAGAPRVK